MSTGYSTRPAARATVTNSAGARTSRRGDGPRVNTRAPIRGQNWYGATAFSADTETVRPGVQLVRLRGDLDLDSSDDLADRLADQICAPARTVLLDVSQVTFCSSAGLGVLADAGRRATADGIDLLLVGVGRTVHRPLEVTGLGSHFRYATDVDDALHGHDSRPADGS